MRNYFVNFWMFYYDVSNGVNALILQTCGMEDAAFCLEAAARMNRDAAQKFYEKVPYIPILRPLKYFRVLREYIGDVQDNLQ